MLLRPRFGQDRAEQGKCGINTSVSCLQSPCKKILGQEQPTHSHMQLSSSFKGESKLDRIFVAKLERHQSPTARNWVQRVAALHLKLESGVGALCNTGLAECLKLKRCWGWRCMEEKSHQEWTGKSGWKFMRVIPKVLVLSVDCDELWYARMTFGES